MIQILTATTFAARCSIFFVFFQVVDTCGDFRTTERFTFADVFNRQQVNTEDFVFLAEPDFNAYVSNAAAVNLFTFNLFAVYVEVLLYLSLAFLDVTISGCFCAFALK